MNNHDSQLVTEFSIRLPGWLRTELARLPGHIADRDDRIRIVNELAGRNIAEGTGGPFAALVVERDSGKLLSAAVNLVPEVDLALAHAEMIALSLAQAHIGSWNLGADPARAHSLVINAQPCAMCLGALIWSGIGELEFAASGADVERITGFDEGPVPPDWREQLESRGIAVHAGRSAAEALVVLQDFRARVAEGSATLYNG
ncbi:nucleoside deaminase [Microlunatus elymi]|uniref:nucleoside deaminase n=1 Tax=Microlunatus elymi TaxID=2596828 RepID=UPI001AEFD599|nr:nucleoside deaminase [Microlunatus elymi]